VGLCCALLAFTTAKLYYVTTLLLQAEHECAASLLRFTSLFTTRLYYFTTLLQAEHECAASLLREQLAASKHAERHAVAHAAAALLRSPLY
jgi:hypothetical protein